MAAQLEYVSVRLSGVPLRMCVWWEDYRDMFPEAQYELKRIAPLFLQVQRHHAVCRHARRSRWRDHALPEYTQAPQVIAL